LNDHLRYTAAICKQYITPMTTRNVFVPNTS
jgi:hypothetical protein